MHSEIFLIYCYNYTCATKEIDSLDAMVSQIPKVPKYVDPKPIGQVQRLPYMLQIERQQPPCPNISHLKLESGSPPLCSKGSELLEDPHKLIKSVDLRC